MKKFYLAFVAILLGVTASFAQPISDHAVIPIGITLNPILRLEITNGNNIEFVFSALNHYEDGLGSLIGAGVTVYQTKFKVLSTRPYDVVLYTDPTTATVGGQSTAGTLNLNVINHSLEVGPLGDEHGIVSLPQADLANNTPIITNGGPTGALGAVATTNSYIMNWGCGNVAGKTVLGKTPDRYLVNVLLEASPK